MLGQGGEEQILGDRKIVVRNLDGMATTRARRIRIAQDYRIRSLGTKVSREKGV